MKLFLSLLCAIFVAKEAFATTSTTANFTLINEKISQLDNGIAERGKEVALLTYDVNQHWMIYAASLVFLMQAGFVLLEAGSVAAKNSTNILFKNVLDACIGAVCFYGWGYAFAYGDEKGNKFIGTTNFFLTKEDGTSYRSFFFQWAFAATAATIVSGAVAERIKIQAYFLYSLIITSIIYPVCVHWVWSTDGLMCNWSPDAPLIANSVNLIDFAGSGVVHLTGGICALVGAIFTGPRIGRFPDNKCCGCYTPASKKAMKHEPHNRVYVTLGVLILWFGWYGFNAGSTLDIQGYGVNASRVTVTTTLSAASAAIVSMCVSMLVTRPICKKYDVMAPLNGILAGLVSITAGCNVVSPEGSVGIGIIGGVVYSLSSMLLKYMRIDDPLDAFAVHGACGIWGVIAVGFFAVPEYVGADNFQLGWQFVMQLVGTLLIIAWTTATSVLLFGLMRLCKILRVDEETEILGLDMDHHLGYTGVLRYQDELNKLTATLEDGQSVVLSRSGDSTMIKKVHPEVTK